MRTLKLLAVGLAFVAVALALEIGLLVAILVVLTHLPHPAQHFLGVDTQQSPNYDVSSGVGPMIVTLLSFTGALLIVWRHVNCHTTSCLGIARFSVGDGVHRVCRRCAVQTGVAPAQVTHEHLRELHRLHHARLAAAPAKPRENPARPRTRTRKGA